MFLGVIEASFVPRALTPVVYGNYSFLLNSARTLRNTLDLGAQQMVFTISSKSVRTGAITKLYGLWLLLQLVVILALVGVCATTRHINWLWPQQHADQIVCVVLLEWIMYAAACIAQLGDTKGLTITTQTIGAVVSLATAAALLGLVAIGRLRFYSYVATLSLAALFNAASYAFFLFGRSQQQLWDEPIRGRVWSYLRQWRDYSSPIVAINIYSVLLGWFDAYLIQRLYGSNEQAYLALSSAISAGVLVFTSSSLSIYWREITQSLGQQDRQRAASVYWMFSQMLFFLTLGLSLWLCVNSGIVISLFGGRAYRQSVPVLMIMSLYPLQQTLGQINSTALLASEETVRYRNLGFALSVPGLALTYLFLAPRRAWIPGLELGAKGIALKMTAFGLLAVQFYEHCACRILGVSYVRSVAHKLGVSIFVGGAAWSTLVALPRIVPAVDRFHLIIRTGIASAAYVAVLVLCTYRWPALCGLEREHVTSALGYWKVVTRWIGVNRGL
jgi:O-antigen/teichoic acid export membrane protein